MFRHDACFCREIFDHFDQGRSLIVHDGDNLGSVVGRIMDGNIIDRNTFDIVAAPYGYKKLKIMDEVESRGYEFGYVESEIVDDIESSMSVDNVVLYDPIQDLIQSCRDGKILDIDESYQLISGLQLSREKMDVTCSWIVKH